MTYVFAWKIAKHEIGQWTQMKMDTDNPVQPTPESVARLRTATALGLVVNIENAHWVAFHVEGHDVWLLDSQLEPVQNNFDEVVEFLRRHPQAFLIEDQNLGPEL